MQYTVEFLELWWESLAATMKDRTMAFPIAIVLGGLAGVACWMIAAYSARLWNKRFYLKPSLQILCGIAALLSVIYAMTYAATRNTAGAVKNRLTEWKEKAVLEPEWQNDAFKDAWDAVAKTGLEEGVTLSPSPRTDSSIHTLPMTHPTTKNTIANAYAHSALVQFCTQNPYLASILSPPGEIPGDILKQDILAWFTAHPGESYPAPRGVEVVVKMLEDLAVKQVEPVSSYTRSLSLGLFIITQLLVFGAIGWFANRSNRPAGMAR